MNQYRILFLMTTVILTLLAFAPTTSRRRRQTTATRTTTYMIFSNNKKKKNDPSSISLPKDVKDAVQQCRKATQEALQNRISRIDIEFPVGTKFGVEAKQKKSDGTPTRQELERSDRELARLFVDMFQPVGGDQITVVFNDSNEADQAKSIWKGDPTAQCRILSMQKKKQQKIKSKGFAAKIAAEIENDESGPFQLPENTQVALFVAPKTKEMITVERICNHVGMETLVVLLNARLSKVQKFSSSNAQTLFQEEFESVFHLAAADQESVPGCLLYRAYPGPWILARKPKVGQPKPILTQPQRPTDSECRAAFDVLEVSELEKTVDNLLENVAGWFN